MATPRQKGRRGMKLAEVLAQEIVADIAESGMAPGDRLPSEVVMAQQRGVSRASLREALRLLEVHGLITIRPGPGGGPELAELDAQDFARMATLHFHRAGVTFRQLLEARVVLEPRMAELAATNRRPEQIEQLRDNLARHEQQRDTEGLVHCAHQFHAQVADIAGDDNKALSLMTSSLHGIFDVYNRRARGSEVMRETVAVHRGIADAIEKGNPREAAVLMEKHMRTSAETFAREHPTLIDSTVSWLSD
jgi:GntR family transcriptional regulator, transcriptional repressor for pyruvate dehydrogenase complex